MHNSNIPTDMELPSTRQLVKSTIIAAVAAGVILVTIVMPAEYGIDKTGAGQLLGLQKMGEIKTSLAAEVEADKAKDMVKMQVVAEKVEVKEIVSTPIPQSVTPILNHEMKVTLAPNEGTEIKVTMRKGAKVAYTWWTDGGKANFDIHGDSKKLKIDYHNYEKGSKQRSEGYLEADFDGNHGWFWRNRTSKTMTVTLQTNGEYSKIEHMK